MRRIRFWGVVLILGLACMFPPPVQSQLFRRASPKLEPVAETKLLMNGMAQPNLRGLGELLRDKPKDAEAWGFARGQALLIAETGNLLLMRPPKGRDAQDTWQSQAAELRDAATTLARAAAAKDYVQARAALASVANTCNRCHQSFRVPTRLDPFAVGE